MQKFHLNKPPLGATLENLFSGIVEVLTLPPVLLPKAVMILDFIITFLTSLEKGPKAVSMRLCNLSLVTIFMVGSTTALNAEETKFHFSIPKLTVDSALSMLARQSNTPLLLPFDKVKSIPANELQGDYTLSNALKIILEGTGLFAKISERRVITVQFALSQDQKSKETNLKTHHKSTSTLLGGILGLFATVAGAGDAIAEDQTADSSVKLEEIVVTAQKRSQNILDVPIAVTSISGKEMDGLEYSDARELVAHVPGLSWVGALSKPSISIRGVGNNDFQSSSSNPVNMYVDGVLLGSTFGISNTIFDLDRVEVLKGPQGTLWGRNSTAGLINFVPKKAIVGEEVNGHASISGGSFNAVDFEGAVSVPLSDKVAARFAFRHSERDGPFKSNNPAYEPSSGGWDFDSARLNIVADLTDNLTVDVSGYWGNLDSSPQPNKNLGVNGGCANPGVLGTACSDGGGFVNTADFYEIGTGFETFERVDRAGIAVKLKYDLGFGELVSTTAYNEVDRQALQDNDASPSVLSEGNFEDDYEGFTQELLLSGTTANDINWVVGGFYSQDQLTWYRSSVRATDNNQAGARFQDISNETFAIFGEVEYPVTEKLRVTLGARLTDDTRTADRALSFNYTPQIGVFNSQTQVFNNRVTPFAVDITDFSRSSTEWSGRVSAMYSVTDNTNLWATISRGFKGGDVNGGATSRNADFNISAPEFLTSYEAGIKTIGFDSRLRLSASGYYYAYKDKQVFTIEPSGGVFGNISVLSNAGKLDIYGADFEADIQLTNELSASVGSSYIHSEFKEFQTLSRSGSVIDFAGNTTANTPEFTIDAIVNYDMTFASGATLGFQADVVYRGDVFFGDDNRFFDPDGANVKIGQDGYALVGANVTYTNPDDTWYVRAFAKNITKTEYFTGGFDFSFRGALLFNIGEPRSFGVTAGLNF